MLEARALQEVDILLEIFAQDFVILSIVHKEQEANPLFDGAVCNYREATDEVLLVHATGLAPVKGIVNPVGKGLRRGWQEAVQELSDENMLWQRRLLLILRVECAQPRESSAEQLFLKSMSCCLSGIKTQALPKHNSKHD